MDIPPPNPSTDIPSIVQRNLEQAANEIASVAGSIVQDILEEYPGSDGFEKVDSWLHNQGGFRYIASEVGYPAFGSGVDRIVFDMGAFVTKFEVGGGDVNVAEWDAWYLMSPEQRRWFTRPYARSEDGTVVIMEKVIENHSKWAFGRLVSQILEQEPWMHNFIDDPSWYNWGYRPGSETPVILDYGL